jgi:hypothetical protein
VSKADYLNVMGISTWVVAEGDAMPSEIAFSNETQSPSGSNGFLWTFVIDQLNGDANILFDKILASIMLKRADIQLINSSEALAGKASGQVIIAMGAELGRILLQLQEPFDELRGSVHSLEINGDELPVILTYHPKHLLSKPADKACAWQDLLLASSLVG